MGVGQGLMSAWLGRASPGAARPGAFLDAACQGADDLTPAAEATFKEHADSEILLSFPGLGALLGA